MDGIEDNLLYEKRMEMELTQEDLAMLLDCDRSTISAWELGLRKPCAELLIPLAKMLQVSAEALYQSIYTRWQNHR